MTNPHAEQTGTSAQMLDLVVHLRESATDLCCPTGCCYGETMVKAADVIELLLRTVAGHDARPGTPISDKFDEVACEEPGGCCEWPECGCRRKNLHGTFACPICGEDTPHHHSTEVEKRTECNGCMNPACEDCFDHDPGPDALRRTSASQDAREAAIRLMQDIAADDAHGRYGRLAREAIASLAQPSPGVLADQYEAGGESAIEAGAQALANDVWHPPQLLANLSNSDASRFRRQARIVLEAALAALQPQAENAAPYLLPCDVQLPPATTIKKGCRLSVLMIALKIRENGWPEVTPEQVEFAKTLLTPEFESGNWEDVEAEEALPAQPQAGASEPVAWQYRCMYDKGHARETEWCDWHDASQRYYDEVVAEIAAGKQRVQVRALCVATPSPTAATEV